MDENVKQRLFITVIALVMVFLYVSPIVITAGVEATRSEFLAQCLKGAPPSFDYCWSQSKSEVNILLWQYLIPFLPALIILWLDWLLKPNLKLSPESFPNRTVSALLWIGLLAATAGIGFPIWHAIAAPLTDVESRILLRPVWISAAWLGAPILFHYLTAPTSLALAIRKSKIILLMLLLSPVVTGAILVLREALKVISISAPG